MTIFMTKVVSELTESYIACKFWLWCLSTLSKVARDTYPYLRKMRTSFWAIPLPQTTKKSSTLSILFSFFFWQRTFVLFYVYKRWNRYLGEWMYGLRCSIQNWEVPGFNPDYVLGQPCYKFFSGAFLYTFGNSVFGHFFQYERDWLIVACPNISIYPSIFLSIYL